MIEKLIKATEEFVRSDLINVDCSHDWNHIERVRSNAIKILEAEQAKGRFLNSSPLLIELSALLHDVGDFKYTKDHSAGPRMVRQFLMKHLDCGINEELIEKVCQIVGNISFRHELDGLSSNLPQELAIVQDADRLDAIGAVGIARCFAFSGAMKRPFYTDSDRHSTNHHITADEYNKQAEQGGSSAVKHFYEKLFKLKDMMKTETGREIAKERDEFMKLFIETIRSECNL